MRHALRALPLVAGLAVACTRAAEAPRLRPVVAQHAAAAPDAAPDAECEARAAELAVLAPDARLAWSARGAFMDELAALGCAGATDALVRLLESGEPDARRRAALCIAESEHDAAVPALLALLADRTDPRSQAAAAVALAAHGNWSGAGAACFDAEGDEFVAGCRAAVEQAAGRTIAEVRAAWNSTAALGSLPRHDPSARLVREWWRVVARLGSDDDAERAAAARVLASGDSALALQLAQAAFESDARLRDGALEALRALGARSEPAVLSLLPLLGSETTREAAARALGASCDPRARGALEAALSDAVDPAWRALLEDEVRRLRASGA